MTAPRIQDDSPNWYEVSGARVAILLSVAIALWMSVGLAFGASS